jgi:hypothetical protein
MDKDRTKELHISLILGFDRDVENRGQVPDLVRTQQYDSPSTSDGPLTAIRDLTHGLEMGKGRTGSRLDLDEVDWRLWLQFWLAGTPPGKLRRVQTQAVHEQSDVDRTLHEMIDFKRSRQLDGFNPVKPAADGTTALCAVWSAAKNTRLDTTLQVGGIIRRHFGEEAIAGIAGGIKDGASDAFRGEEFGIFLGDCRQLAGNKLAVGISEHFGGLFRELGSVEADPDAVDLRPVTPKGDVLLEVGGARKHRARDGPMDIDLATFDVFQDALVGGRFAANIMMFGESVDRDGDSDSGELHPFHRDRDNGAGDNEGKNFQGAECGKNPAELTMADQRFTANQGYMDGLVFAYELQNALDKCVAAQVTELAQGDLSAQVRIPVGVAARATERALASDLDGEHREATGQDSAPRGQ